VTSSIGARKRGYSPSSVPANFIQAVTLLGKSKYLPLNKKMEYLYTILSLSKIVLTLQPPILWGNRNKFNVLI
jgi:hypothetical protein